GDGTCLSLWTLEDATARGPSTTCSLLRRCVTLRPRTRLEDRAGGRAAGPFQRGRFRALHGLPALRRGDHPGLCLRLHPRAPVARTRAIAAVGARGKPLAAMTALNIEILCKSFPAVGAAPSLLIYRDFHLSVEAGSFLCLLGPSGVGKTTLLNMVAGLDRDFEGHINFVDKAPAAVRLAYVFQSPRLLPWRTLLENLLLVLPPGEEAREEAHRLLQELGLAEAAEVYPERLSLGMQRRAALARAFAVKPDLLLMDEPFVSLDEPTADRLRDLLHRLLKRHPATVLFVTHDSREAIRLADRILLLQGPAPVRVRRDMTINLAEEERRSESQIEALRQQLLSC